MASLGVQWNVQSQVPFGGLQIISGGLSLVAPAATGGSALARGRGDHHPPGGFGAIGCVLGLNPVGVSLVYLSQHLVWHLRKAANRWGVMVMEEDYASSHVLHPMQPSEKFEPPYVGCHGAFNAALTP